MNALPPLAHSAPDGERRPHLYADHIHGAVAEARAHAEGVAPYLPDAAQAERFVDAVVDAAAFHDLGKLDPENQPALRQGRGGRMPWDHMDAGVAHLVRAGAFTAAWSVRGHHSPGLPARATECSPLRPGAWKLRGGRIGQRDADAGDALVARTDRTLDALVSAHMAAAGQHTPSADKANHGLFMRLALSCLVDGDHGDAARYEHGRSPPPPPAPRWTERLAALDAYVERLDRRSVRQADRDDFYRACRNGPVDRPMVGCEGPVGIGKTTAVTAWCLRRAIASSARRIFIVAPYTTILSQTARILRHALTLPDEADRQEEVVAEHHHRADFQALESRELATLWRAPIVVTTSVQFFETLAACQPARLRKLHGLPGSVVFLDEAHAILPAPLWQQNWAWMQELADGWGCSFVFASGSLARLWEKEGIVRGRATCLPDLVPPELAARLHQAEHRRVRFHTLGRVPDPIEAILRMPGPRLAVVNTVQTTAVIADRMRKRGADVLHLSTALCPTDRDRILKAVRRRLDPNEGYGPDWTLIATSLMEAGVDLSFRTGLRERFSTASLIQIGGRINRHGEWEFGDVIDFLIDADGFMTTHPDAVYPGAALERLFAASAFATTFNPAMLVTHAIHDELRGAFRGIDTPLAQAEAGNNYPEVARLGCLIDADTRLVVVDKTLETKLSHGQVVSPHDLLAGSVQIGANRIEKLGLAPFPGRPDLYLWSRTYDPDFLGYMAGVLDSTPSHL